MSNFETEKRAVREAVEAGCTEVRVVGGSIGASREALQDLIKNWADHQSWRCGHPDRYPWEPNGCPCGLTEALRAASLPLEWASR